MRALRMLRGLPDAPRVVDFGCGSGASTLVLAAATGGEIVAVDLLRPFLGRLTSDAAAAGLSHRIAPLQADMTDPPLADGTFDLVWAEGAIYVVGFETGLRRWRRLLPPGGWLAVTEATWLTVEPPPEAAAYWSAAYPAMTTVDANLMTMHAAGFEVLGHFALPASDWEDFYGPLERRLDEFRRERGNEPDALGIADAEQRELDLWRACGTSYGYVFYLGRRVG